jgi:hypothetical protein
MSWTKRQLIEMAFESVGLAGHIYALSPEQLQNAHKKLDAMMGTLSGRMTTVYPLPANPEVADLDEETNLPDTANEAVYLNLGLRIAPGYGKQVTPDMKASARLAMDAVYAATMQRVEMQMPQGIPLGAGHKTCTPSFSSEPEVLP